MEVPDIKRALRARGIRQVDLAQQLGIDQVKLSLSLGGKRKFTVDEMDAIRTLLGENIKPPEAGFARPIPIIGRVSAGNWREAIQHTTAFMPSPDPSMPPHAVALTIDGDSMDLLVEDGGSIIYDPDDRTLFSKRYYVVLNEDGETTFKQFLTDPARLVPCSSNPAHREIDLSSGQPFTIVGRVIWRASRL